MSIKKGSKTTFIGFNNTKHIKADSVNNIMSGLGGFLKKNFDYELSDKVTEKVGKTVENLSTVSKNFTVDKFAELYGAVANAFDDYSPTNPKNISILTEQGDIDSTDAMEEFKDYKTKVGSTIEFQTEDNTIFGYIKTGSHDGGVLKNDKKTIEFGAKSGAGAAGSFAAIAILGPVGLGVAADQIRRRYNEANEEGIYHLVLETIQNISDSKIKQYNNLYEKLKRIEF